VTVVVTAASPEYKTKLETLHADVARLSLYGAPEPDRLARLRAGLAGHAEFSNTLRLAEAIADLHDRDTSRRRAAAQKLEEIRQAGRPVWKDLATEMLASYAAQSGDKATARRLVKELPHHTYQTQATLRKIGDLPANR
jgi:hypothetical protein